MKTLEDFKRANAGQIFLVKIYDHTTTLLSFKGEEEMKQYVFANEGSKRILFDKISSTALGNSLLGEQLSNLDIEELERAIESHADKYSLIETIGHDVDDFILIDTDHLEDEYWNDLLNRNSHVYLAQDKGAFAIIAKLINEG